MKPRVLLVDDESSIRESLGKLLQAEQYDVVLAVDGQEAVDQFQRNPSCFDLVLTDLVMPSRNGWAGIDRLLEINPLLPIIVLTGMSHQRELAELSAVSALVEKPVDVPIFLDLVRALLAEGLPRRRHPFQYVPSRRQCQESQSVDPYAHWGLNE